MLLRSVALGMNCHPEGALAAEGPPLWRIAASYIGFLPVGWPLYRNINHLEMTLPGRPFLLNLCGGCS